MKKYILAAIGLVVLVATVGLVTAGYGPGASERPQENFVDEDGDGICDNMIDEDDDGINDGCLMQGSGYRHGNGYGPGDGSGNDGVGPRDGSGYGPGAGNCPYDEE
ncbi:MAG: hypothetical protein R6U21_03070 [Thermoplasmatota archaeon]